MAVDVGALVPAVLIGLAGALVVGAVFRPAPRLAPRFRPYNSANRVRLGKPADVGPAASGSPPGGPLAGVFAPMLTTAAKALSRLVDHQADDVLAVRLRNAGYHPHLDEEQRLARYRVGRLGYTVAAPTAAGLLGLATGSPALLGAGVIVGFLVGLTWPQTAVDAAIKRRRDRMTIDLHAVNHHLAISQKTGSGIDEALQRLVERGRGPVVAELADALQWRRAGMPLDEALTALAERTAEPHAARTYKTLSRAAHTGAPIGDALEHLSEEVRDGRRDALRRQATRRRHAMIVPIMALLFPPLVIFVGAPLPTYLFGP